MGSILRNGELGRQATCGSSSPRGFQRSSGSMHSSIGPLANLMRLERGRNDSPGHSDCLPLRLVRCLCPCGVSTRSASLDIPVKVSQHLSDCPALSVELVVIVLDVIGVCALEVFRDPSTLLLPLVRVGNSLGFVQMPQPLKCSRPLGSLLGQQPHAQRKAVLCWCAGRGAHFRDRVPSCNNVLCARIQRQHHRQHQWRHNWRWRTRCRLH